jgi:hypothetical protein
MEIEICDYVSLEDSREQFGCLLDEIKAQEDQNSLPDVANPESAANAIPFEVKEVFGRVKKTVNEYLGPKPMLDAHENLIVYEDNPIEKQLLSKKSKASKTNDDDILTI